jgi:hypothetical protein
MAVQAWSSCCPGKAAGPLPCVCECVCSCAFIHTLGAMCVRVCVCGRWVGGYVFGCLNKHVCFQMHVLYRRRAHSSDTGVLLPRMLSLSDVSYPPCAGPPAGGGHDRPVRHTPGGGSARHRQSGQLPRAQLPPSAVHPVVPGLPVLLPDNLCKEIDTETLATEGNKGDG